MRMNSNTKQPFANLSSWKVKQTDQNPFKNPQQNCPFPEDPSMLLAVEMQESKKRTCGKFMHDTTIKQQADFKLQIDQKFQQPQKGNSVNIVAISQGYAICRESYWQDN